ncbi:MAG TPA: DNA mismatch repair protein MutS, partial [Ktedonobacterales bacterium]
MGIQGSHTINAHANDHQSERELSPVRQQYLGVKRQHPDAILFFRMGDFYEMFDDDAEICARELELTLTGRDFGRGLRSPMAGVPHHAADGYIARLIAKGYRVAVCEQVSDPALSRGLVEREVIRVVTPGTVIDPAMLAAKRNNFLAAAALGRDAVGIAYVDITTGEFACTQFAAGDPEAALAQELSRVQPAEALIEAARTSRMPRPRARWRDTADDLALDAHDGHSATTAYPSSDDDESNGLAGRLDMVDARLDVVITPYDARHFREDIARERLMEHFAVASLEAFGCEAMPLAVRAAGAILAYLHETQRGALAQITGLETYSVTGFMTLDAHTRRNLELFESGRSGSVKGSLLSILDLTRTPMGGRLLRRWLGEPLLDLPRLRERQAAVATAKGNVALRARLTPLLGRAGDIERLINRALQRIATPRDLVALANGLRAVAEVAAATHDAPEGLARVCAGVRPLPELQTLIASALVDEPPLTLSDGGFIRQGYHPELDTLTDAARNGRQWVADLERKERERTGINNLRVGYNKVFGYYLEVTNSQVSRVPEGYIRKQTLSTGERYITPDLKEYEALILNAHEKSVKLEQELFSALRAEVAGQWGEATLRTARALAELDTLLSLG